VRRRGQQFWALTDKDKSVLMLYSNHARELGGRQRGALKADFLKTNVMKGKGTTSGIGPLGISLTQQHGKLARLHYKIV
jgi:hypothetical protein